nr:lipid-A-disaccharide synthase [uncultured Fretibacterium sp.]
MSLFVSCGEVSGDLYAAGLVRALLRRRSALRGRIWGMMGPRTEEACGEFAPDLPRWSYEELKLMGITEVLPAIPRLLQLRRTMVRAILERRPEAVVVVDSPDFHLGLVSRLRCAGYGGKTVYLATPTVWAWRSGRVRALRRDFDLCLPLFSFEHRYLAERGVNSRWAVHPLVEGLKGCRAPEALRRRTGRARVIALMPGSRRYDIRYHLERLMGAARILRDDGRLPIFSIAPGLSPALAAELRERLEGFETWDGEGRELMEAAEAVAGVSGTVAVEAMLLRRYMVVIYNGNAVSWAIARALVRIPYISIPNYLAGPPGTPLYPELLRGDARPERIVQELYRYTDDPAVRSEADRRMEEGRDAMGVGNAAGFWAEAILP